MAELAVIKNGRARVDEDDILTPTHFGHEPKRTDVSTINPYPLESIPTTSALVPVGPDNTTNVHNMVAVEKHRPPSPGDVTPTEDQTTKP